MTKTTATPTSHDDESPCQHCQFPVEANMGQAGGPFPYVHSMTGQAFCKDEQKSLKDAFPPKIEGRSHGMSASEVRKAIATSERAYRKM